MTRHIYAENHPWAIHIETHVLLTICLSDCCCFSFLASKCVLSSLFGGFHYLQQLSVIFSCVLSAAFSCLLASHITLFFVMSEMFDLHSWKNNLKSRTIHVCMGSLGHWSHLNLSLGIIKSAKVFLLFVHDLNLFFFFFWASFEANLIKYWLGWWILAMSIAGIPREWQWNTFDRRYKGNTKATCFLPTFYPLMWSSSSYAVYP